VSSESIRAAVVGYGGAFNMGRHHAQEMQAVGFRLVAVADLDASRLAEAARDFPDIRTYQDPNRLFEDPDVDLVVVVTPHNTHAALAEQALQHGKHCIVEKPFCLTTAEADRLVALARQTGRLLSVYHNRRWDGWYLTVKDLAARGLLGEIFHVELAIGGYGHPGHWWRSDRTVSGGAFYDWGAHLVDYGLGLIAAPVRSVYGVTQKRVWHDVTNEDHVESFVTFENGAVLDIQVSSIARAPKPPVRILGTRGGVVDRDWGDGVLTLYTDLEGIKVETQVSCEKSQWRRYYENIAAALRGEAPLAVTPEEARRVIAVIETTARSAEAGKPLPLP
jgi:scyllo-inositol 2-dehydrogenase (NADP+)